MSIQVPVLTAFEQYRAEVVCLCSRAENEQQIIQKARAGDEQAREQIIALALRSVITLAYRYKVYLPHDGLEDIVSIGNVAIVECVEKALPKERPIGFLVGCARIAIIDHVSRFSSLIAKQHYDEPTPVMFLDDDLEEHLQERKRRGLTEGEEALLYRAVTSLPAIQQEVIIAQYRLYGHTDDNLFRLHKRTGKKPGHYNKMIRPALKHMRRFICEQGVSYGQSRMVTHV